jgi:hypothetical protein
LGNQATLLPLGCFPKVRIIAPRQPFVLHCMNIMSKRL